MLTQSPLPTWKTLLSSLAGKKITQKALTDAWCHNDEAAGWLSRSAWSLALIALWKKTTKPDAAVIVWLPDFFCNSSLIPLRRSGVKILFYKLLEDMSPDMPSCNSLLEQGKPDMMILVHYFGKPSPAVAMREFCIRHNAWLIEDAAHVLKPVNGIGEYGDFVLYSPHKLLPIPDGAVLVIRSKGPARFTAEQLSSFGPAKNWPDQLIGLYETMDRASGMSNLTWLLKRIIQKLPFFSYTRPKISFQEPLDTGVARETAFLHPAMSRFSEKLFLAYVHEMGNIARKRQSNLFMIDEIVRTDKKEKIRLADRPVHRSWTPYLAAYKCDILEAESVFNAWQDKGMPVTTWPDLPPEVIAGREAHSNAWRLRHTHIFIPCHQSLAGSEIQKLFPKIQGARLQIDGSMTLRWETCAELQWNEYIYNAGRSNLLQSWQYGEAKRILAGWKTKRGVFYKDGEPVALVQLLQKKIAGITVISRINRGPVFLRELDQKEQADVYKLLADLAIGLRGFILSIAPELKISGHALLMLAKMGFRKRRSEGFESAWVNLQREPAELRKQLEGRWRNPLAAAEKSCMELEMGDSEELFNWLMNNYQSLMKTMDFAGPSIALLQELRKQSIHAQPLLVFKAIHENEAIGGICVAQHGAAATYLVGWNGVKGRNLKANHYLLWQAMMHLRQSRINWLDLGGIDEERTAGVAQFKLGLNGERYENIGEYIKI
jgi:dTDP-4-amino-4,6-dideoxygalactose transaminase